VSSQKADPGREHRIITSYTMRHCTSDESTNS
jgi:hypothetical protein